jgi:hypothetical protein
MSDIVFVISSYTLEPANSDGLRLFTIVLFNPRATTGRFARPIAGST